MNAVAHTAKSATDIANGTSDFGMIHIGNLEVAARDGLDHDGYLDLAFERVELSSDLSLGGTELQGGDELDLEAMRTEEITGCVSVGEAIVAYIDSDTLGVYGH